MSGESNRPARETEAVAVRLTAFFGLYVGNYPKRACPPME